MFISDFNVLVTSFVLSVDLDFPVHLKNNSKNRQKGRLYS